MPPLSEILVKDVMSKPVKTIDLNKNVKSAAILMSKTNVGSLVVTKNNKPIGMLTDTDIIKRVVAKGKVVSKVKVKDVMSRPLIFIRPNDTYLEAARKLKKNNIKRLPVISDKGKLVGLVSMTDIAITAPEMLDLFEYRLKMREEEPEIREEITSGICDNCDSYSEDLRKVNDQWLCESCREDLSAEK